jgi:sortase A
MSFNLRATRAVRPARTQFLRVACYVFLTMGIFALGYAGFIGADSHVYQALEMKRLRQAAPSAEPRVLVNGDVIGEIQVPRLGMSAIVVQGDSPVSLRRAVGHLPKSALPGERGNVVLAGHRDTFFRPLREIQVGDQIRFKTRARSFEYVVEFIEVVAPGDIQVLQPSTGHDLTFITCFPFQYVGPAPKRFVVHAREVARMPRDAAARG